MNRSMVIAAGLAVLAGSAGAEEIDRTFEESFPAPPGTVLHLEHGDGNVEITPWDRREIDVSVRYRGERKVIGFGSRAQFTVKFEVDGNTVRVIGDEGESVTFGLHYENIEEYRYTVRAPADVVLDLEGDDGDVMVESWRADIEVDLDDGDLVLASVRAGSISLGLDDGDARLTDIAADLFVEADDGTVTLQESKTEKARFDLDDGDLVVEAGSGNYDVETDDGDVRFSRVRMGNGTVRIQDGDVTLSLLGNPDLNLDVEAGDGDVHLDLEPGMSVAFTVRSDHGRLDLDLSEVADLERDRHRVSGSIHGGRGHVRIRTGDGNVSLRELSRSP